MENLKSILEIYNKENINPDEIMFIEMIDKYKSWQLMTDEEKFQDKKQSLLVNIKFDGFSLEIEYERQIIIFLEKLLSFFANINEQKDFREYHSLNEEYKILFRIYYMLYSEKELLLYTRSSKGAKIHIPFKTFEDLINQIKLTSLYKKYKLKELFEKYSLLVELFSKGPYSP
ncbi:hypothetical protein [Flavobacterium sp. 245]|uniref:hypothetical protein n=1 Tax=Flavobacterium sp. 245 TaxID=2512115 RepID=UPI00105E51FD|nr:hypothetical protein [Flavobacterium sp. 245]TDO94893.1 hypothetical protein EV145_11617 [Flavobacterium sp. 245]